MDARDRETAHCIHIAYGRMVELSEMMKSVRADYTDSPSLHRAYDDARDRLKFALSDFISTSNELRRAIVSKGGDAR